MIRILSRRHVGKTEIIRIGWGAAHGGEMSAEEAAEIASFERDVDRAEERAEHEAEVLTDFFDFGDPNELALLREFMEMEVVR